MNLSRAAFVHTSGTSDLTAPRRLRTIHDQTQHSNRHRFDILSEVAFVRSAFFLFLACLSSLVFAQDRPVPFDVITLSDGNLVETSSISLFQDKTGYQPTCVMFARAREGRLDLELKRLTKLIDGRAGKMKLNLALVLIDASPDSGILERFREEERIRNIKLAYVQDRNGPEAFEIKEEDLLTVFFWSRGKIQKRVEFPRFESRDIPRMMQEISVER